MSGPFFLAPVVVTDEMVTSSNIAEPDTTQGEAVWDAGTSYAKGQEAILPSTHRVYECIVAGIDTTSPDVSALQAAPRWIDKRATNKWQVFDSYASTQSRTLTSMVYVLRPGIFNALAFYGADGGTISVVGKVVPGGETFFTYSGALIEPPIDEYDYYFGRIKQMSKLLLKNIEPQLDPEFTVTITSGPGAPVKLGMLVMGDLRSAVSVDKSGGTQYDAKAKPTTTSLFINDGYGGVKIVKRTNGTDLDIKVFLPQADADAALQMMRDLLDVPCAVIASDIKGYAGLNTFGLASGDVQYAGPTHAYFNVSVRGLPE